MNKVVLFSLLVSISYAICAYCLFRTPSEGPFFFVSDSVLSSYAPVAQINKDVGVQDEMFKKREKAYNDSIMGLFDSVSVSTKEKMTLVDLLNLESRVYTHKKKDSIALKMQQDLSAAMQQFNGDVARFCEKKSIPVLFSSNGNTVVYGQNTKADLSNELIEFFGAE